MSNPPPEVFEEPWVSPCGQVTLYRGDCFDHMARMAYAEKILEDSLLKGN